MEWSCLNVNPRGHTAHNINTNTSIVVTVKTKCLIYYNFYMQTIFIVHVDKVLSLWGGGGGGTVSGGVYLCSVVTFVCSCFVVCVLFFSELGIFPWEGWVTFHEESKRPLLVFFFLFFTLPDLINPRLR